MGLFNNRAKSGAASNTNARSGEIEFLNSPSTRHVDDNASNVSQPSSLLPYSQPSSLSDYS